MIGIFRYHRTKLNHYECFTFETHAGLREEYRALSIYLNYCSNDKNCH